MRQNRNAMSLANAKWLVKLIMNATWTTRSNAIAILENAAAYIDQMREEIGE